MSKVSYLSINIDSTYIMFESIYTLHTDFSSTISIPVSESPSHSFDQPDSYTYTYKTKWFTKKRIE